MFGYRADKLITLWHYRITNAIFEVPRPRPLGRSVVLARVYGYDMPL